MLIPLLVVLLTGVLFGAISGFILVKILKVGIGLSISIIFSCTFGFPTTLFMPQEVSQVIDKTEDEKIAIRNYLEPRMLTGGFVTVTIISVILAGIVAGMI